MNLNFLPELLCGDGYTFDWNAILTLAAVLVALWIAIRDKRDRQHEQLALEARAASMVSLTLSGFADVFEKILKRFKETGGITFDSPGCDVIYGVENCQNIIDRESFFHQLPIAYVDQGELVLSLAKQWIREIDVRRKVQKDPELRVQLNWRDTGGVENLGTLLREESMKLREKCKQTSYKFSLKSKPFLKRIFKWNR